MDERSTRTICALEFVRRVLAVTGETMTEKEIAKIAAKVERADKHFAAPPKGD